VGNHRDPLRTPTRITFAGDWHMNTGWATTCVYAAADMGADVIIHTGDFGYAFYPRFLRPLGHALEETGLRLLFVDGNHEDHRWIARQPQRPDGLRLIHPTTIWHLPRGFRWTWGGVQFLALGGAHSVDQQARRQQGLLWQREELITPLQAQLAIESGPADVMVTHDCPTGVKIPFVDDPDRVPPFPPAEIVRANQHRALLRTVVDAVRPASLWHGHYHINHAQDVDLGWPMTVVGLDCDGVSLASNLVTVDLDALRRNSGATARQLVGAA
jgi:predicted phosphodiesterase